MNWLQAVGRLFRRDLPVTGTVLQDRLSSYFLYDGYYHNTVFNTIGNGGQRDFINQSLGNAAAADVGGLYNPVARCVDLYQHVFGGDFGGSITAKTDNDALLDPLSRIWRWSNINVNKQVLQQLAPTHGNAGIRIVARNAADLADRRVYLKFEHPSVIRDVEQDDRGNLTSVLLQYDRTEGLDDAQKVTTIRELQTKDRFTFWTVTAGSVLEPMASYQNDLGVVPYVLLAHAPSGDIWGRNAFYRAMDPINRLNTLVTHIQVQIHRHVRAKLAVAAAGDAPTSFDLDDLSIAYFNTRNSPTPPSFQWLVAPLNLADAIDQSQKLLEQIEDELPELKATAGKFLANQSGETVAQLRKPAEDRLSLARTNYEDALLRAQQIALSLGILYDLWDLGTGTGTKDAADRAYRAGNEDHVFNDRELLPLTALERVTLQVQKQAVGVTKRQSLAELGYKTDEIDAMLAEDQANLAQAMIRFNSGG